MLKKLYKENQFKFYFDKRESYSHEDVMNLLAQHGDALIGKYDRDVDTEFGNLQSLKDKEIEKYANIEKELAAKSQSFEELSKQKLTLESQVKSLDGELAPIRAERKTKTANELLKGLVTTGAEVDVYDLLNEQIQEIQFGEKETPEEKQKKLKPIVNKLFEAKPYFKPITTVVEEEENLDDKLLVIDEKTGKTKETDYVSTTNRFGFNG